MIALGLQQAQAANSYGPQLEGFSYPYPLQYMNFSSQSQQLQMGYMDRAADKPEQTIGTVVLLHGKNFCAATWDNTIDALNAAGYRVIAPDQIGFCSSSKPENYQYTFQQLAENTHALLGLRKRPSSGTQPEGCWRPDMP